MSFYKFEISFKPWCCEQSRTSYDNTLDAITGVLENTCLAPCKIGTTRFMPTSHSPWCLWFGTHWFHHIPKCHSTGIRTISTESGTREHMTLAYWSNWISQIQRKTHNIGFVQQCPPCGVSCIKYMCHLLTKQHLWTSYIISTVKRNGRHEASCGQKFLQTGWLICDCLTMAWYQLFCIDRRGPNVDCG